jgi:hypothetical protein
MLRGFKEFIVTTRLHIELGWEETFLLLFRVKER